MLHTYQHVDPGLESAAVPKGQTGTGPHEKRLGIEIWRGRGYSCISQKTDSRLGFDPKPSPEESSQTYVNPMCIEWATEQVVPVVLITDGDLPGGIPMFAGEYGSSFRANSRRPLGPCRGRKKENY